MSWPIEHFHYIPAPSSFIEMMPGAMKAMTQCAVNVPPISAPTNTDMKPLLK